MTSSGVIDILSPFVSEHKKALVERILKKRTGYLTLVFEDIDKPHNISAVLRTAECMGIQNVHFIKNRNDYQVNPKILQGSDKWLTLHHHQTFKGEKNISACYQHLRHQGYQIWATSLHDRSVPISALSIDQPTAVVFGTERLGISNTAASMADRLIHIPMKGFTESFNLSVSAAIILNTFLPTAGIHGKWRLNEEAQIDLKATWYKKIVRNADLIIKQGENEKGG